MHELSSWAGLPVLLSVLVSSMPLAAAEPATGPDDIFLLIGQSNMAGRAPLAEEDQAPLPGTLLLNDQGRWEPASNPLNRYASNRKALSMQRLGPGDGFARRLHQASPARTIGLIVNARGGTSIEEWAKGQVLYDNTLKRLAAIAPAKLSGVIWHQGEANAKDPKYLDKLVELVENLRRDLNAPALPFVAGQVAGEVPVNAQIAGLPERLKYTAYASAEGLTVFDGVHFDRDSQKKLGTRYAEAALRLLAAKE